MSITNRYSLTINRVPNDKLNHKEILPVPVLPFCVDLRNK